MEQQKRLLAALNSLGSDSIHTFREKDTLYKILILQRGEMLFFSMNNKSLIMDEFSALTSQLSLKGMDTWIDGAPIVDKDMVIKEIKKFYKIAYKDDLTIFQ